MPSYRLLFDHGHDSEEFEAPDDDTAEQRARVLADEHGTTPMTGYQLARSVDGAWQNVRAWLPRRVARNAEAIDDLVPPPSEG